MWSFDNSNTLLSWDKHLCLLLFLSKVNYVAPLISMPRVKASLPLFFRWEYRSLMSRSATWKCDPGTSAQQKNKELKNKKAPILRALFLYHIFKQTGAVPINGVSGYFTPRPPKRLLKRATWPSAPSTRCWPVHAGWLSVSMLRRISSPGLPHVERVLRFVPSVMIRVISCYSGCISFFMFLLLGVSGLCGLRRRIDK